MRTLKARRLILGWAAFVGAVMGLAAGLLLPKVYEATATVLVDSIQKDHVTGLYEPRLRVNEFLGQQAAIAGSRVVALSTLNALEQEGALSLQDFEDRWRRETGGELVAGNDPRRWAADELLEKFSVASNAVEGTLKLTFRGDSPAQAAIVANQFADAYIETALDQRQRRAARTAASFLEERRTLERDLEDAQRELNRFREEAGLIEVGEYRLEGVELELAGITNHLADARADFSKAETLLAQSKKARPGELLALPIGEDLPSAREAQARLALVSAQLELIAQRYGAQYPDYPEVKRDRDNLEGTIRAAIAERADHAARRLEALEREFADKKAEVVRLQRVEDAYQILKNKVTASRDTYSLVANRTLQEAMQSRVDDVDVVLLSQAVPATHPLTPPLAVIIFLGALIGAALGASAAIAVEFMEGRIRDASQLRHVLRAPVLAEIDLPRRARPRRKIRTLMLARAT
jgi:uncharacterized protein involved in exopolysaccharide biosynthesis